MHVGCENEYFTVSPTIGVSVKHLPVRPSKSTSCARIRRESETGGVRAAEWPTRECRPCSAEAAAAASKSARPAETVCEK